VEEHRLGLVLGEQQAAILLLLKRSLSLAPVDQTAVPAPSPDYEFAVRAIFAHLRVVEQIACADACSVAGLATLKVARELVAKHLMSALEEERTSGSLTSYGMLRVSLPVLFAAEVRAFGEAGLLADVDLGSRVAEHFTELVSSLGPDDVWTALAARSVE
jgi:hypothetical protein